MRAIDTNVLVRLLARDDPQQTASAENFVKEGAWVPLIALVEAIWVLARAYKFGSKDLIDAIGMLLKHESYVLQDEETVAAALDLYRAQPALGFSDCLILEMARKAGHLPLGTFDRKLGRVGGAHKL